MERIFQERGKRVGRNQGGPGVDGMTIEDAETYLREQWPSIRSQLLEGTYQPQPVKRVKYPSRTAGSESSACLASSIG